MNRSVLIGFLRQVGDSEKEFPVMGKWDDFYVHSREFRISSGSICAQTDKGQWTPSAWQIAREFLEGRNRNAEETDGMFIPVEVNGENFDFFLRPQFMLEAKMREISPSGGREETPFRAITYSIMLDPWNEKGILFEEEKGA